jgi:3-dehydroquinate synthase
MTKTRTVHVAVPGAEYDVHVRAGILAEVGQILRKLSAAKKAAVVTDSHVGPNYLNDVLNPLKEEGFEPIRATVPAGEDHKTTAIASTIYDQLLVAGIERSTPVIALGGGVIGDMAGFVAATILRGVPFVQVPTTLLSMVDASVGGKTGVNHAVGKNLIGAFHQPITVIADTATLRTLPQRELRSGLAECIKHDIIRSAPGFEHLEKNVGRALKLDLDYLTDLVAHNIIIKAAVVAKDPHEHGERAHLNFGHTFGHAIESVSRYQFAHGECVAYGMVAATRMAVKLGMLDQPSCDRILHVIDSAGFKTRGLSLRPDDVLNAMMFDKKVQAGKVRFILPTQIGQVTIRDDVPAELVKDAVASLR